MTIDNQRVVPHITLYRTFVADINAEVHKVQMQVRK